MHKKFTDYFLRACRHQSFGQYLDDFLTVILCALSHGQQEERYLETIKRHDDKAILETLPTLFGMLQVEYLENVDETGSWCDPLGTVYEEYSSTAGRKMSGQFFTPIPICDMMARMTMGEANPDRELWLSDPACGSGRTLLATGRLSPAMNNLCRYVGVDIDRVCAMMCAVNMFYHGLSGAVIHGDTLALKAWGGWRVRPHLARVDWLSSDAALSYLVTREKETPEKTVPVVQTKCSGKAEQLSLF